jgi:hydrogenase maturation protease
MTTPAAGSLCDGDQLKRALSPTTLVLGIGNLLLTDEGAGIHVVRYLTHHHAQLPRVEYVDGGTLNFLLVPRIEEAKQLVVVDAANLGAPPGTCCTFYGDDMDHFLQKTARSAHEVGLLDLLTMARLVNRLPARRVLIGIQPGSLAWGDEPSPPVALAITPAAHEVVRIIERWNHQCLS